MIHTSHSCAMLGSWTLNDDDDDDDIYISCATVYPAPGITKYDDDDDDDDEEDEDDDEKEDDNNYDNDV